MKAEKWKSNERQRVGLISEIVNLTKESISGKLYGPSLHYFQVCFLNMIPWFFNLKLVSPIENAKEIIRWMFYLHVFISDSINGFQLPELGKNIFLSSWSAIFTVYPYHLSTSVETQTFIWSSRTAEDQKQKFCSGNNGNSVRERMYKTGSCGHLGKCAVPSLLKSFDIIIM